MSSSLGKRGRSQDENGQTTQPNSRLPPSPARLPSPAGPLAGYSEEGQHVDSLHPQSLNAKSPTASRRVHPARRLARGDRNAPTSDSTSAASTTAAAYATPYSGSDAGLDRNAPIDDEADSHQSSKRPKLQHRAEYASHAYAAPPPGNLQRNVHHVWNTAPNSASPVVSPMSGNNNSYSYSTTTQHTHINYGLPGTGYLHAQTSPTGSPSQYPQYANASPSILPPSSSASHMSTPTSTPLVMQQPSVGLLNARAHFTEVQWHGLQPKQYPDVDALQRRLVQAAMDMSSYYDSSAIIDRLKKANFSQADIDMACYHLVDVLVNLHTPGIGTKNRNKSDPTNESAKKIERKWTLDERANLICRALRECKKVLLDVVEKPNDVEYLLVLAPQSRLKSKFNNMDLNDGKKHEKERKDRLIADAKIDKPEGDCADDDDDDDNDAASPASIKPKKQTHRRSRTNSSGSIAPRRQPRASAGPAVATGVQHSSQNAQPPATTLRQAVSAVGSQNQAIQHMVAFPHNPAEALQQHTVPQYSVASQRPAPQQYAVPKQCATFQQYTEPQHYGVLQQNGAPQQYATPWQHQSATQQLSAATQAHPEANDHHEPVNQHWLPANAPTSQPLVGMPSPKNHHAIDQFEYDHADGRYSGPYRPSPETIDVQSAATYKNLSYFSTPLEVNVANMPHTQASAVTASQSLPDSAQSVLNYYGTEDVGYQGQVLEPTPASPAGPGEGPIDPALFDFNVDD